MKTKKLELYFINSRQGYGVRQKKEEPLLLEIIAGVLIFVIPFLFLIIG